MIDIEVLLAKAASIDRCVARVREEVAAAGDAFATDFTRQDAAILNLQRACESAIDMAQHIVRAERLGLTTTAGDAFTLLATSGWIPQDLATRLRQMTGFRNIAVHNYQPLHLDTLADIVQNHLDDFAVFTRSVLLKRER